MFFYNGIKYFIQGYFENNNNNPVAKFENAKIFDGKTFWEVEKEFEWIDANFKIVHYSENLCEYNVRTFTTRKGYRIRYTVS